MGSSSNAFYVKNVHGLRAYQSVASIMLETLSPGSLLLPFCLTLPFHSLQRSFRFNSSRPFDTSFLSFQRFYLVHVLLPFVSSRSCGDVLPFVSIPILSFRLHLCFIATRLFRLLLPSSGFNTPPRWLLPSFRFNSFLRFAVKSFISLHPSLRFTSFINPICYSLSFHSKNFFNSFLPFGRSFRFNSSLSFVVAFDALLSSLWPLALAATCSSSHLRPLAATPVAASGCFFEIQIPRELQPQWLNCLNPSCFLLEILIKS